MTIYSIFEFIVRAISSIFEKGGRQMPRARFQTLTEQMFYILLCLRQECCGADIAAQVASVTGGRVAVGPGTLYNLLESFFQAGMIRETRVEGRKRSYILMPKGARLLEKEYGRIRAQAEDYRRWMGKE